MTTIAYRNGIIAGDSRVTDRTLVVGACPDKVGVIGRYAYMRGEVPKFDHCQSEAIVVSKPKELRGPAFATVQHFCTENYSVDISFLNLAGFAKNVLKHEFFALGSGAEIAIGAMAFGASAVEAVNVAACYDSGTALPIKSVEVPH
jgi:hypothetical protein